MKRVTLIIHIIMVGIVAGIIHAGQLHQNRMEGVLSIQNQISGYSENIPWVVLDPVSLAFR